MTLLCLPKVTQHHSQVNWFLTLVNAVLAQGKECLPKSRKHRFANDAVIRDARRTLETVYTKSGVQRACSHRFRHTLATEILEMGGTFEEAADILGDTEAIVRKHYAKWSAGRQARTSDLLERI